MNFRRLSIVFLILAVFAWFSPAHVWAMPSGDSPAKAEQEGHEKTEGSGNMNPLSEIKSDLALWTGVVFVLVFLVLYKFAWGPISQGLEKREGHIAGEIRSAEEAHQKAKQLLADYEKKLVQAVDDVRGILEKGRQDAERVGQELIEKAKSEATAEKDRAVREIRAAEAGALKELADRSAAMAVDLAGKIVHAKLSAKDHSQLIEQAITRFTSEKVASNRN